ncbi:GvpL/GvpF family gas vesicle protein [Nonomuraea jiangxiensis]|uniref:Gas vesicle synthesis protein GvpL/GvpF n=1 Tax=Nonomuraea jiangxiensis TaxID=633440 RepID=A0A1G8FM26_9ACTN|nr:GvpL/GvpF family gas vesicle protein [Nonomuraea jiangxiensis]SDH83036.1 Gas vesicle synthesis protein GvpL/GvpF [Nonomuraea jiangxiensis]
MARSTRESRASVPRQRPRLTENLATYVYGIVPADMELDQDELGVGEPAGRVEIIRHGEIGALASDIDADQPLGRPGDYLAYERLLDSVAARSPVLPFRFGAVLSDPDAVVTELLEPHHDDFLDALDDLGDQAEYIVRGRYVEATVLGEVLAENPEAAGLRQAIRGLPPEATRNERIRLGEIIAASIEAKRDYDTNLVLDALSSIYSTALVREPTHEQDAVHVALLVRTGDQRALERALTKVGDDWEGRVDLRLLGPLAPYDFVTAQAEV